VVGTKGTTTNFIVVILMKTRNFMVSGKKKTWLVSKSTGAVSHLARGMEAPFYPLSEEKISVDTGGFTPGVYRVNPYTVFHEEVQLHPYKLHFVDTTRDRFYEYHEEVEAPLGSFANVWSLVKDTSVPAAVTSLRWQALQRVYGKIQKADVVMGENLGELRETIQMLRSPLLSLRNFLKRDRYLNLDRLNRLLHYQKHGYLLPRFGGIAGTARLSNKARKALVRKDTVLKASEAAKAASDTWLELRYGLRPLVLMIQSVVKEVTRAGNSFFDPSAIKSLHTILRSSSRQQLFDSSAERLAYGFRYHGNCFKDERLAGTASVQYRQSMPTTELAKWGLTPDFALETAWELTHLSFVVDWLFTVGPWLATFRHKPGVTVLGNTCGEKVDRIVTVTQTKQQYFPYNAWLYEPIKATYRFEYYKRFVNQDLPLLPLFTAGRVIDLFRAIDSTALILQRMLKGIRR